jgi:hypothetical protein
VNLWHRHGDAAAQAGEGQQCMYDIGRHAHGWLALPMLAASMVGLWNTGRCRRTRARGSIVDRQKMPMPTWVWRQPTSAMKCWTIGGQITPERELPIVASDIARPRWRSNQREASTTNGAKLAALPRPMVTPETTAKAGRGGSSEEVAEAHEDRARG